MFDKILSLFEKKVNINEETLKTTLDILEAGNIDLFTRILYNSNNKEVQYLPITNDMLLKVKKPSDTTSSLLIFRRISRKKCTLLILDRPWILEGSRYYPIIIQNSKAQIIGIMLPFNELHGELSRQVYRDATDLGVEWTGFVILNNFK